MYSFDRLMTGHTDEVLWLKKRALAAAGVDRQEFGTVTSSHLGVEISVAHDRGADLIEIHGIKTQLIDISRDLRMAITSVSAAFSAAQTDSEQSGQKRALQAVIDAVLREHPDLAAKVRQRVTSQRYD
jgi:hypothetical protein